MLLEVKNLHAFYDKSHIIHGINLKVEKGEVVGILGRNGVGKTTLLRSILGLLPPRKNGTVLFKNIDVSRMPTNKIIEMGIGYIPQGRHIFPKLTVMENLSTPVIKGKVDKSHLQMVFDYFPVLKNKLKQLGGTLSGGQQQMLAIGRAMISNPKLIIIDEPTEGLQPSMVNIVRKSIRTLSDQGITIIIADQNLENALELCNRIYVLEKGKIKYEERHENLSIELLYKYLGVVKSKKGKS